MKSVCIVVFTFIFSLSFAQFCGTATNKGLIAPTPTVQTATATGNGQRPYYRFIATKNCSYTFETCSLTSMDTELEILNNSGVAMAFNDDGCSSQSKITWICPTSGTYSILITRYDWFWGTCEPLNSNVRLKYSSSCVSPLPVELISFNSECSDGGGSIISWTTASESNSSYFQVEGSDDLKNWYKIDSVLSAGSSNIEQKYQIKDEEKRKGIYYYRLSQFDINGESVEYNPISLFCVPQEDYFKIYPNPSNGSFMVETYSEENIGYQDISLIDANGKVVYVRNVELKNGTSILSINPNLESGIYFVKIKEVREKLIIVKQ